MQLIAQEMVMNRRTFLKSTVAAFTAFSAAGALARNPAKEMAEALESANKLPEFGSRLSGNLKGDINYHNGEICQRSTYVVDDIAERDAIPEELRWNYHVMVMDSSEKLGDPQDWAMFIWDGEWRVVAADLHHKWHN